MKKFLAFLAAVCMMCAVGMMSACNELFGTPDEGSASSSVDSSTDSSEEKTHAAYTTEYWFETANGYERNDELTTVQQGEIGKTVQTALQNFSGYFFESSNPNNVLRGRVKEDGSLVLKAYYSLDYSERVVIQTELSNEIDILKGEEKQLAVTVLVDGQAVTEGVVFKSEDNNIQISDTGLMTAKMRGQTTVTVSYKNVSKSFTVSIWDAYIATEADWWKVYENTALWYKFTADVTLSENTVEHFTDTENGIQGYLVNHDFSGVIDGGNYSLTYNGARLFNWVSGQIKNITLYAGEGFYWGAPIAYGCTGGIITNVTVHAAYNTAECLRAVNEFFWIKLGGNEGVSGNGGMFGMIETGAVISNCTVYMDVRKVDASAFGGIAYQATNSVVENCVVYSTNADVSVIELNVNDTTTITNCEVHALVNTAYTVEYYFETDDGFVKNDEYTYQGAGLVGDLVTANTTLGVSGFEFDAENENNVISGLVEVNGTLVLKVYYKKAAVTVVIESTHAEAFEMDKTATVTIPVTVTANGEPITEGINWTSGDESIVTVADGVVTVVKGGQTTITVSYLGMNKTFTVSAYDRLIATESDWWSIYESTDTLAGWYKLANDVTLTKSSADYVDGAYNHSETFTGKIDGNGHTLTYSNNRLFCWMSGATIENINLVAGNGFYWGAGIAFGIQNGSVVRNVTADFTFVHSNATYVNSVIGWISMTDIGAVCIYLTDATLDNVDVTVTLADSAKAAGTTFYGLATEITNSTAINCNVKSVDNLELFKTQAGTNNTEGSTFTQLVIEISGAEQTSYELLAGATQDLGVSASFAGEDKTSEVVYTTDSECVTVANGVITAVKGGKATVTASFMGKSLSYTVTVYNKYISTEEDWWSIYASADTLAGWYKLANDVTLTKSSADYVDGAYNHSETFTGKIDGNGHTLTYSNNRLFCWMSGATIENINLVAGNGFYWGAGIAFGIQNGSVIRNVTADFTFVQPGATYVNSVIGWVTVTDIGAVCIYLTDATLDNVDVNGYAYGASEGGRNVLRFGDGNHQLYGNQL